MKIKNRQFITFLSIIFLLMSYIVNAKSHKNVNEEDQCYVHLGTDSEGNQKLFCLLTLGSIKCKPCGAVEEVD